MNKIPKYLFKYGALKNKTDLKRLGEVILDNKVYLSSPSSFNDPFDCRPKFNTGSNLQEKLKTAKHIDKLLKKFGMGFKQRKKEVKKYINGEFTDQNFMDGFYNQVKQAGVYSLTEDEDNLLMWSHYANYHKGYCLKFSTNNTNDIFSKSEKVIYQKTYPIVSRP